MATMDPGQEEARPEPRWRPSSSRQEPTAIYDVIEKIDARAERRPSRELEEAFRVTGRLRLVLVLEIAVDLDAVSQQGADSVGPALTARFRRTAARASASSGMTLASRGRSRARRSLGRTGSMPSQDSWRKSNASEARDRTSRAQGEQPFVARRAREQTRIGPSRSPSSRTRSSNVAACPSRSASNLTAKRNRRRDLLGPAPELILGRNPVAGRVQLDRVEALRVVAEEVRRARPGRVEAGPPGRIRPAGSADIVPSLDSTSRGRHTAKC